MPQMTSSTSLGSMSTLLSTSLRVWADMSSGRASTSEPLLARPIGVRDVDTMTASAMAPPQGDLVSQR